MFFPILFMTIFGAYYPLNYGGITSFLPLAFSSVLVVLVLFSLGYRDEIKLYLGLISVLLVVIIIPIHLSTPYVPKVVPDDAKEFYEAEMREEIIDCEAISNNQQNKRTRERPFAIDYDMVTPKELIVFELKNDHRFSSCRELIDEVKEDLRRLAMSAIDKPEYEKIFIPDRSGEINATKKTTAEYLTYIFDGDIKPMHDAIRSGYPNIKEEGKKISLEDPRLDELFVIKDRDTISLKMEPYWVPNTSKITIRTNGLKVSMTVLNEDIELFMPLF